MKRSSWVPRYPLPLEGLRRQPVLHQHRRKRIRCEVPAGRIRLRHVRRKFQLARSGLVPHQLHDPPRAAPVLPLLWRRVQSGMPDWLRQHDDAARDRFRTRPPSHRYLHARRQREQTRQWRSNLLQPGPQLARPVLFYEYFHGDNGAGIGASHQTGWTGLVAPLLDLFGRVDAKTVLELDRGRVMSRLVREQVSGEDVGQK